MPAACREVSLIEVPEAGTVKDLRAVVATTVRATPNPCALVSIELFVVLDAVVCRVAQIKAAAESVRLITLTDVKSSVLDDGAPFSSQSFAPKRSLIRDGCCCVVLCSDSKLMFKDLKILKGDKIYAELIDVSSVFMIQPSSLKLNRASTTGQGQGRVADSAQIRHAGQPRCVRLCPNRSFDLHLLTLKIVTRIKYNFPGEPKPKKPAATESKAEAKGDGKTTGRSSFACCNDRALTIVPLGSAGPAASAGAAAGAGVPDAPPGAPSAASLTSSSGSKPSTGAGASSAASGDDGKHGEIAIDARKKLADLKAKVTALNEWR